MNYIIQLISITMIIFLLFILIRTAFALNNAYEGCGVCSVAVSVMRDEKSYFIVDYLKLNWYSAFEHCAYLGMQLLTINSENEFQVIRNIALQSDFNEFWTSGMKINSKYIWVSTGVDFTKMKSLWGSDQPNNTSDCVMIDSDLNYFLRTTPCLSEYHFICEAVTCEDI